MLLSKCPRVNAPVQTCATNVVARQCGQEVATVLGGLAQSIRGAAGCPVMHKRSGNTYFVF